jgi:hypothetical protein
MPEHLSVNLVGNLPGWTYGELIDYFSSRFDDERSHVELVIKQVVNEIMARHPWKWLASTDTVTTEAGVQTSALDFNLLGMDTEYMVDASNAQLVKHRSVSQLRRWQAERGNLTGRPTHFAYMGDSQVLWFPTPDAAYTFSYDFTKFESDQIDDDSVPPLPRHFQHVLVTGVEEILRMDDDRMDGATNLARRKFEKQILDMIWREESGEQVRMQPDEDSPDVSHPRPY